jgi:hypothetical protein
MVPPLGGDTPAVTVARDATLVGPEGAVWLASPALPTDTGLVADSPGSDLGGVTDTRTAEGFEGEVRRVKATQTMRRPIATRMGPTMDRTEIVIYQL